MYISSLQKIRKEEKNIKQFKVEGSCVKRFNLQFELTEKVNKDISYTTTVYEADTTIQYGGECNWKKLED